MRCRFMLAIICIVGIQIVAAEPTARTYIFAAMEANFSDSLIDSLAKYFDVVITHDAQREYNPMFRDSNEVTWRKNEPPWVLLYKDAMTFIGPRFIYDQYGSITDTIPADSTLGGGATVGGFWHFDSIFHGYGAYSPDTFFMMKSDSTLLYDSLYRVHAGSEPTWQWRWAMDYGESDWQDFYGCSTKVQCLRNYADTTYDDTYFNGVFMDNLLQYVNCWGYGMFPMQYMIGDTIDSIAFRSAVHSFAQTVAAEYHNPATPPQNSNTILGIANLNRTYKTTAYDSIWCKNLNVLDGGMEESFVMMGCSFADWYKFLHEISIAESLGKTCLMCHKVDSFAWTSHMPFSYTEFDSTDLIYGFTSYLMAFDSLACFYFTPKDSQYYTFVCRVPIVDVNIGKPMGEYILTDDSLGYRYYEEAMVFCNSTDNSLTAGFSGDTLYELGPVCDIRDTLNGQFTLGHHKGVIGLYSPKYFHGSGFEPDDRLCWEDYCLEVQGITNYSAKRVTGDPPIPVTPHSSDWMYRIQGTDISSNISLVRFKIFPYDIPIEDSTYFSYWIYVDYAPGDSVPIGIDCLLKSGKRLSEWSTYGTILDQYGRAIVPAGRRVPEGAWYQYVFTLNPAVNETIDHIEVVYYDTLSQTGNFCAYIDDIAILDGFPILDCWHCEQFPTSPTNGDSNFYMNFVAQDDSVKLTIDPKGGGGAHWVQPTPRIRNNITNIPVDSTTAVVWQQYDRAHSLILSLLIHDDQGGSQWLRYAKNASNWWPQTGWVDMEDTSRHYNVWEGFFRNITNDYTEEYGSSVEPESIIELRLEHFAWSEWDGDSGGTIKDLCIAPFTQEFTINQNQNYTNMAYVALQITATSELSIDSMEISQVWYDPPETRHDTSSGWISYDTAYVWCLHAAEGVNTICIQYMIDEMIKSPIYFDSIIFDKTAPTGSFVINNNDKFTNTASIVLYNSFTDTTLYKMRYGNVYLKQDIVKNTGFDSDTLWRADTAVYHSDYQLYEIPILSVGNSFYQSIPADSLVDYEGDTMYLWIDLVSDDYSGMGKVMFQYIYSDTSDCGTQPYGTSITITPGTNAKTSWYNMASYFVFQPDTDSVFTEARIGIWVDPSENSGTLYIDNFKLDITSPQYDYSKFEDYDTLEPNWLLNAGNGVRTVFGQFSDEAGNETVIFFDTIIVDTTKPVRKILSPQHGRTVSDTVAITGWAYDYSDPDQHFKQYALQYQSLESEDWYGIDPDSLSTTPIYPLMPPDILGKWNTNSLSDGWYNLRLTVQDSATNYQDTTISVQVDNSAGDRRSLTGFANEVYGIASGNELYISELSTGNIYKYNNEFELVDSFTVSDSLGTGAPLAMSFDINGNLWLTNITSQFINKFSTQGNLLAQFSGNFSLPSGLAFDNVGSIWISDRLHHKIKRYDQTGTMISSFGTRGSDPGELDRPLGVAFFDDKVYISDSRNKRISVFDTVGVFVQTIGDSAGLKLPFAMAVDTAGYLFVTDALGDQVIEFDPYGNQVYRIDSIFDTPSGLAISPGAEILYVADTKNKRVLAFDIIGEPETGGGPQAIGEVYLDNIMYNIYPTLTCKTLSIQLHGLVDKQISLKIYDITGRLVRTLCDYTVITSNQTLTWDGKDDRNRTLSNGIYFISLEYDNNRITKKAILLR